jgi:hypothetical protein
LGAPGAPGAPGAAEAGSSDPQLSHVSFLDGLSDPQDGHFFFTSSDDGLKHISSVLLFLLAPF